jgi:hypothetical protein
MNIPVECRQFGQECLLTPHCRPMCQAAIVQKVGNSHRYLLGMCVNIDNFYKISGDERDSTLLALLGGCTIVEYGSSLS